MDLGAELTVLTRDAHQARQALPHLEKAGIVYLETDVRAADQIQGDFSHLIHAATPTSQIWRPDADAGSVSIDGTRAIMRLVQRLGKIPLLHCSSGAVYASLNPGDAPPTELQPIENEDSETGSTYADAKIISEKLVGHSDLNFRIARCFAFLGPHLPMDGSFAAGQFLKSALEGKALTIKGTGRDERSYMYPTDLMTWLWTLLFTAPAQSVFNVGSPSVTTISELAEAISRAFALPKPTVIGSGDIYARYVPDVTKAAAQLGLECLIDLEESVRRTKEWAQQSPR